MSSKLPTPDQIKAAATQAVKDAKDVTAANQDANELDAIAREEIERTKAAAQ